MTAMATAALGCYLDKYSTTNNAVMTVKTSTDSVQCLIPHNLWTVNNNLTYIIRLMYICFVGSIHGVTCVILKWYVYETIFSETHVCKRQPLKNVVIENIPFIYKQDNISLSFVSSIFRDMVCSIL